MILHSDEVKRREEVRLAVEVGSPEADLCLVLSRDQSVGAENRVDRDSCCRRDENVNKMKTASVIQPQQMLQEEWRLQTLLPAIQDTQEAIRWLARRGDGSWFEKSKISLPNNILLFYCWHMDLPQVQVSRELEVSTRTVVDWMNFIREVCEEDLRLHPQQVGGLDEQTGLPIIVEIDESKYFHRKYHRGQWREGHWVFGGIERERESGRCFMVEVPDRTRATLEPIVLQYVLLGSHIISDGWRAYGNLAQVGGGIYLHDVIVHDQHFVDPNIHTNNIENTWMRAKRKLRRQFGTSEDLFPSYLAEFLWRNSYSS
nr:hypothetical protein BaRGS_033839 [Batillaria attramentaria]